MSRLALRVCFCCSSATSSCRQHSSQLRGFVSHCLRLAITLGLVQLLVCSLPKESCTERSADGGSLNLELRQRKYKSQAS